jgi:hypothetical protein
MSEEIELYWPDEMRVRLQNCLATNCADYQERLYPFLLESAGEIMRVVKFIAILLDAFEEFSNEDINVETHLCDIADHFIDAMVVEVGWNKEVKELFARAANVS